MADSKTNHLMQFPINIRPLKNIRSNIFLELRGSGTTMLAVSIETGFCMITCQFSSSVLSCRYLVTILRILVSRYLQMHHGSVRTGFIWFLIDFLSRGATSIQRTTCVCAHALNKSLSHCLRAAGHTVTRQTSCRHFVGTGWRVVEMVLKRLAHCDHPHVNISYSIQAHAETFKRTVQILHSVSSILLFNLEWWKCTKCLCKDESQHLTHVELISDTPWTWKCSVCFLFKWATSLTLKTILYFHQWRRRGKRRSRHLCE